MNLDNLVKRVLNEKKGVFGVIKDVVEELTEESDNTSDELKGNKTDIFDLQYETVEINEDQIKASDHIQVMKGSASQHGICVGDNKVVHKVENRIVESTLRHSKGLVKYPMFYLKNFIVIKRLLIEQ